MVVGVREPDGIGQQFGREFDCLALRARGVGEITERIEHRLVAENVVAEKIAADGALLKLIDVADLAAVVQKRRQRSDDDATMSAAFAMLGVPCPDAERATQRTAPRAVQRQQECRRSIAAVTAALRAFQSAGCDRGGGEIGERVRGGDVGGGGVHG
jgi:hypothetical protein